MLVAGAEFRFEKEKHVTAGAYLAEETLGAHEGMYNEQTVAVCKYIKQRT